MGVRSSMSISLVLNDELWGLVACHSYGDEGIRVPLPIRELCRNIGECASVNIDRLLMSSRLLARKPPENVPPKQTPSGFVAASSADLLAIFDADFGMLSIQDEARTIGKPKPYREALALLAHLQKKKLTNIVSTQNIEADFPHIKYAPGIKTIAGLLIIPLSLLGGDFIVFFRTAHLKEVRWAGNPYEKLIKKGTEDYLEPRSSFHRWTEMVMGTSKEWTDDQSKQL
jgi:light-regulated signal transduction histidine kinase (bacteriophytochrome)